MRTLILAAALISTPVMAESIAWVENQAGGNIVLTNEPCILDGKNFEEGRKAITYASGMPEKKGCWGIYKRNNKMIAIVWQDRGMTDRVFDMDDFEWKSNAGDLLRNGSKEMM